MKAAAFLFLIIPLSLAAPIWKPEKHGWYSRCGYTGISKAECEKIGCIYKAHTGNDLHHCHQPSPSDSRCDLQSDRVSCGYNGITKYECIEIHGCCWAGRNNGSGPKCFLTNVPSSADSESPKQSHLARAYRVFFTNQKNEEGVPLPWEGKLGYEPKKTEPVATPATPKTTTTPVEEEEEKVSLPWEGKLGYQPKAETTKEEAPETSEETTKTTTTPAEEEEEKVSLPWEGKLGYQPKAETTEKAPETKTTAVEEEEEEHVPLPWEGKLGYQPGSPKTPQTVTPSTEEASESQQHSETKTTTTKTTFHSSSSGTFPFGGPTIPDFAALLARCSVEVRVQCGEPEINSDGCMDLQCCWSYDSSKPDEINCFYPKDNTSVA